MVKQKVLDLANKISRTKRGKKDEITPDRPEYRVLEPIVTDEMAEVALCLAFREPKSAQEISVLCGKPVETTERLLWELALAGAAFVNKIDGVDKYWMDIWVPGHMELIVNNRENVKKYPQLARAFDEYGKLRGPKSAGIFPVGTGVMRVIPIQQAIQGETRRATYEEISKYLEENTIFSVSDCSCRTSREVMGEGCGHLKEEMCIQLGFAAEYYIRTGRGKQISREEAYTIIKRAEENGLMHSIPNTDGPGHTHAICNCCGCSCFVLRIANMFVNPDMVRSNYVSQVDKEQCVACGECVESCPTNALRLGQKLCAPLTRPVEERELPYDTEWGPDKWNPEYRLNRKVVTETGSSPCKAECPAHIGIQGYIKLAAQGKYSEALRLIKEENPFPAVCGRVCPHYCESACTRGQIDDPVAIDEIKKFIAEQDLSDIHRYVPKIKNNYGKKIAVIGSGPAGLSCAYFLALKGYQVTVFEKEATLGGMLAWGIPPFRLEKDVVKAEIDVLRELHVEFKTGVEVGRDITLQDLRNQGFSAFYLAIGAQLGKKIGIEGEDIDGVISGLDFLRKANLAAEKLKGSAAVIGGGNVAVDVARTALRLGASQVDLYCLEKREDMPASQEEIEEALAEGIAIKNSWGPVAVLAKEGRVAGVEFKKCTAVFDENKNFSPKFSEEERITVKADHVLISAGQTITWGALLDNSKIAVNADKTIKADPVTYQTAEPDVFAGGDVFTGPKFAIDAIAMGKEAAISIHRFVQPGQSLTLGRTKRAYSAFAAENLALGGYDRLPRQKPLAADAKASRETLRDLRGTFTAEQVKMETERCLDCGTTVADEFLCVGCGLCVTKCRFSAVKLVRRYDKPGVEFRHLKSIVVKYALKRKLRIKAKKAKKFLAKLLNKA